jgi:uncharacterized lipoprotein YmbA
MTYLLKPSLLGIALMLAACRSEPVHYHTLVPAQLQAGATRAVNVRIESISVPPQVDREQIVVRQGDSGLAVLDSEWWGASLVDELRSALGLRLEVQRFDSVPGQYALLEARWRLRTLGGDANRPALRCHSLVRSAAGTGIAELVAAQQRNVARLAGLIAQAADDTRAGCPASGS